MLYAHCHKLDALGMKKSLVMYKIYFLICACLIGIESGESLADNHLTETRYCGAPARNSDGSIKRSYKVRKEFDRLYPLPTGYNRYDWQIDHVIPLSMGGVDAVRNLQWLPKEIKTCSSDACKDRWERIIYLPKSNIENNCK